MRSPFNKVANKAGQYGCTLLLLPSNKALMLSEVISAPPSYKAKAANAVTNSSYRTNNKTISDYFLQEKHKQRYKI